MTQRGQRLRDVARALPRPEALLDTPRQRLDTASHKLPSALRSMTQVRRVKLTEASAGLRPRVLTARLAPMRDRLNMASARLDPDRITDANKRRTVEITGLSARLDRAFLANTKRHEDRLTSLERMRQTLGYTETLKRGYAVVRGDGDVVTNQAAAAKAKALEIEFADGRLALDGSGTSAVKPIKPATKPKPKKDAPDQGSLF